MSRKSKKLQNRELDNQLNDLKPSEDDLKLPVTSMPEAYYSKFSSEFQLKPTEYDYKNKFLQTIMTAYNKHLGLHLSPDNILLAINNIVSRYINTDPEQFRDLFVNHKDKKQLHVNMDKLSRTKDKSIWDLTLEKWVEMIDSDVKNKELMKTATSDFSTSTYLDVLCSKAFIMDMTKAYYEFTCSTMCGIPVVHLHGTLSDWNKLLDKLDLFVIIFDNPNTCNNTYNKENNVGLSNYLNKHIRPILINLIKHKQQYDEIKISLLKEDLSTKKLTDDLIEFWSHIISHTTKYGSGGGTFWSGWLTLFFPDIRTEYDDKKKSDSIYVYPNSRLSKVPSGTTDINITFDNNGTIIKLNLIAGFHGVEQLSDGSVKVITGYQLIKDGEDDEYDKDDKDDKDDKNKDDKDDKNKDDKDNIILKLFKMMKL